MQESVKILLFDLGNILVSLNSVDAIWSGGNPDGPVDAHLHWSRSTAVRDYESGRIPSLASFYAALRQEADIKVDENEFYAIFNNAIGEVFPGTYSLLQELKEKHPLYLLSNTSEAHWAICRDQQKLDTYFTKALLSYEMGVMKPDPRAFELAIAAIQSDPQNIWYYDDRKENVDIASKLGFNAYVSFGGDTLINDLRNHGFLGEMD